MTKIPSVLIAIPCYGGQVQDTCLHGIYKFAKHASHYNIDHELYLVSNESLISTGRSNIANFFVNDTKYDYLMCIDSDIGFKWEDIVRLLSWNKDFVTGAYSMKTIPPDYNFLIHPSKETDDDLIRLSHIGTGFHLVHRNVFKTIADKNPQLKYMPDSKHRLISDRMKNNSYHFYETIIDGGIIPEDISFCRRYNEAGGKIWLDPNINLTHAGNHIYSGIDDLKKYLFERINK